MSTIDTTPAPAPLDPAKVKAGDTVTLENCDTSVRGPVVNVEKALPTDVTLGFAIKNVGWRYLVPGVVAQQDSGVWTLTNHQPAPEPEPVVAPGIFGTAHVTAPGGFDGRYHGFTVDEKGFVFATVDYELGVGYRAVSASQWTDFVPDEPRPLPTREEIREALTIARHEHESRVAEHPETDDGMQGQDAHQAAAIDALLRGESR